MEYLLTGEDNGITPQPRDLDRVAIIQRIQQIQSDLDDLMRTLKKK